MEATENRTWLSYEQAIQHTGLGRTSIWKIVSGGHVEAVKHGRRVMIKRASLDAYLESHPYSEVVVS